MLDDYTELTLGKLKIFANWNEAVKPARKFKVAMNGVTEIIDRDDLYTLLMLFGDPDQQEQLIPVVETKVKQITRLLKVRAKKDMKKGEILVFPYTYFMPVDIYEKFKIRKEVFATDADQKLLAKHASKL